MGIDIRIEFRRRYCGDYRKVSRDVLDRHRLSYTSPGNRA